MVVPEVVRDKQKCLLAEEEGIEEDLQKKHKINTEIIRQHVGRFFERATNVAPTYKLALKKTQSA